MVAPSNPVVSIGPLLAVRRRARAARRPARPTWWRCRPSSAAARSKGPADRMLGELGRARQRRRRGPAGTATSPAPSSSTTEDAGLGRRGRRARAALRRDRHDHEHARAGRRPGPDGGRGDEPAGDLGRRGHRRDPPRRSPGRPRSPTPAPAPPNGPLADGDVLVVTQKIVSKAEGRLVPVDPDDPLSHKSVVEAEAVRILRRRGDLVITETRHGFVCANSGVDLSNVQRGEAALLPIDSDRSARRIRDGLRARLGVERGHHRVGHLRAHLAQAASPTSPSAWPASPASSTCGARTTPSAASCRSPRWPWPTSWPRRPSWSWGSRAASRSPSSAASRRSGCATPASSELVRPPQEDLFR